MMRVSLGSGVSPLMLGFYQSLYKHEGRKFIFGSVYMSMRGESLHIWECLYEHEWRNSILGSVYMGMRGETPYLGPVVFLYGKAVPGSWFSPHE
jgi:hypothetical protein